MGVIKVRASRRAKAHIRKTKGTSYVRLMRVSDRYNAMAGDIYTSLARNHSFNDRKVFKLESKGDHYATRSQLYFSKALRLKKG